MNVMHVRLVGMPALLGPGETTQVLSAKDAALLALPLLDGALTRQRIVELLWPDSSAERALISLRQRRHRLKKQVGTAALLDLPGDRLALALPHDLENPEARWTCDASALPGRLLGNLDFSESEELDALVQQARERWDVRRARALREQASRHEDDRRYEDALAYRQRLCDDDPLDEAAHADLMRLHYLRADMDAARAVFDGLCQRLSRTLGVAPSPAIAALHERLQRTPPQRLDPAVAALVQRPPRLVGRAAQWRELTEACALGRTAVVLGEPGMGKSRLVEEFLRNRDSAVTAALRPADRTTSYGLLARVARAAAEHAPGAHKGLPEATRAVLAAILPEWGTPVSGPIAGPVLQSALRQWLQRAGVQVVAIDDLQSADAESLAVLADSLHASGDAAAPWWLLALRRAEVPTAVQEWLDASDAPQQVHLPALGEADVADLLQLLDVPGLAAADWAPRLHRHSGGNPLFLLETVRAMKTGDMPLHPEGTGLPLPGRVLDLLQRRIAQLGDEARRLAGVAAVADDDLDAELAAAVLNCHPLDLAAAWRELEQAQLLHGRVFAHDLLRGAARQSLPAAVAQATHARVAAHLQQRGESVGAERAARHWLAAGRAREAGAAFAQAALRSRRLHRRDEEARWWAQAAQALQALGPAAPELFAARAESLEALLLTQGPPAALALAEELLPLARDDLQRQALQYGRLKALLLAGQFAAAAELAPEVMHLGGPSAPRRLVVHAELMLAQALGHLGRGIEGLQRVQACAAAVDEIGDEEMRYEHLMAHAYLLRLVGRHRHAVTLLDQALPLAQRLDDGQELLTVLSNRSLDHYDLGHAEACHADASRAHALMARLGDVNSLPAGVGATHFGAATASLGRYDEAVALYEEAQRIFAAAGATLWLRMADMVLAVLFVQLGQFARAGALVGGDWQAAAPQHAMRRHLLLARMERWQGRPIAKHIEAAQQLQAGLRATLAATTGAQVLIEASYDMPPALACEQLLESVEAAAQTEQLAVALLARSRLAECLLAVDPEAAHAQALRCLAESAECRVHDSVTTFWHACARVFRTCGDTDRAEAVVSTACRWLHEVALPNTRPSYRPSFVERNPAVRELLIWGRLSGNG
jgi:DNA-binding SARP family transcriptional activator